MQGFHSLPGHAKVFGLERQSYNCKKRRAEENGKRNGKVKMLLAGELQSPSVASSRFLEPRTAKLVNSFEEVTVSMWGFVLLLLSFCNLII